MPLEERIIFSGNLFQYQEDNKKWRNRFSLVPHNYGLVLYENKVVRPPARPHGASSSSWARQVASSPGPPAPKSKTPHLRPPLAGARAQNRISAPSPTPFLPPQTFLLSGISSILTPSSLGSPFTLPLAL